MSPRSRLRGAVVLLMACTLGGLAVGSVFSGSALADDGSGSTPAPVTVTIPDLGQTPTPSPTASPSSVTSPPVVYRGGGGAATVATPPHQPGTEPSIPKNPATGTLKVTIAPSQLFRSGDHMRVTAKGFTPGEKVQLVLYFEHGKPVKVGNFVADASGAFSHAFVLPPLDAGTEVVQLTGWDSSKVGTSSFLLGASWVAPRPNAERLIWLWFGGIAGLAAVIASTWFGVASLRRVPAAEVGAAKVGTVEVGV